MNHSRSNFSIVDFFFGAPAIGLLAKMWCFFFYRGNRPVTQRNAAGLLKRAYLRVVTLDTAENSFRACGIYPFNPPLFSPGDFGTVQVSFLPNRTPNETSGSSLCNSVVVRRQNHHLQTVMLNLQTFYSLIHIKVKVKCTLVQALRLYTGRMARRGSRGIALPFLDHYTRRR